MALDAPRALLLEAFWLAMIHMDPFVFAVVAMSILGWLLAAVSVLRCYRLQARIAALEAKVASAKAESWAGGPITIQQGKCKHLRTTKAGSNQYQEKVTCKDCKQLLRWASKDFPSDGKLE